MTLPTKRTTVAQQAKDHIMMFYGPPGVGKTTFVDKLGDNVLFLSTDRGTRNLKTMRVEIFNWAKLEMTLQQLEKKGAPQYDFICMDHVDDFANMAEEAVCKDLGIASLSDAAYGKAWSAYRKRIQTAIRRLLKLGAGLIFIAHEKEAKVNVRSVERDTIRPELSKPAGKVIIPLADLVGYCTFKEIKTKEGRKEIRILQTQPTLTIYAKDRTKRNVPEEHELLDGKAFLNTFNGSHDNGEAKQVGRRARR